MVKKFGTNSKSVEGKEKKQKALDEKKKKDDEELEKKEALKWNEGAKQNKKLDEEQKRLEKLAAKKERELALSLEMDSIKGAKTKHHGKSEKVAARVEKKIETHSSSIEEFGASNIDDALLIMESSSGSLNTVSGIDRHPERRMKAAYAAFEEKQLPILKKENPTLRLSQLKEILYKMWQKSPENPFNQDHTSYDVDKSKEKAYLQEKLDSKLESLKIK